MHAFPMYYLTFSYIPLSVAIQLTPAQFESLHSAAISAIHSHGCADNADVACGDRGKLPMDA
jgi:hypothetical protein